MEKGLQDWTLQRDRRRERLCGGMVVRSPFQCRIILCKILASAFVV